LKVGKNYFILLSSQS